MTRFRRRLLIGVALGPLAEGPLLVAGLGRGLLCLGGLHQGHVDGRTADAHTVGIVTIGGPPETASDADNRGPGGVFDYASWLRSSIKVGVDTWPTKTSRE